MRTDHEDRKLLQLCERVKRAVESGEFEKAQRDVLAVMGEYPESPIPHNLLGAILEKENKHAAAMRHFRAAYALDPSYRPAKQNLDTLSSLDYHSEVVFEDADCAPEKHSGRNEGMVLMSF